MKFFWLSASRLVLCLLLAASAFCLSGCYLLHQPPSMTVFYIRTEGRLLPNGGCPPSGCKGYFTFPEEGPVSGWLNQASINSPSPGSIWTYEGKTDFSTDRTYGQLKINDPIVEATWSHKVTFPCYCQIPPGAYISNYLDYPTRYVFEQDQVYMKDGATFEWPCYTTQLPPIGASRLALRGYVPSQLTLPVISQADPFSITYGQPVLDMFSGAHGAPTRYASVSASSVAPDGSSATFPLPSSMPQGAYAFVTSNKMQDGGLFTNAYNAYIVADSQKVQGNPFGVAIASQSTQIIDCNYVLAGTPPHQVMTTQCAPRSPTTSPVPVISLYSFNQVKIGNAVVSVGQNPTAVATYTANAVVTRSNTSNGYTQTIVSGSLRAIVTNSGGNTVSILDTLSANVVATVTVGSNPVAIAVSSDGSAAYIANYGDSTVTKLNLSTNIPVTTAAVGGKPTSVTLTSGGVLWVGGAGFLTQINPSTMAVVGTESMVNRSVSTLAYSNDYGQLIVQSTDAAGTMYQDEMNPVAFHAGGQYAALASRAISTMGSYPVQSQVVRAFSSTIAGSSSVPRNLPGAPPIVVQDGWVVIAATPTGFTITDISGHIVLVSQATPSPIAAIALDPNFNVAYLTEPDSNTVLTVPLPRTN